MISFIIPVYNKGNIIFKSLTSLIHHLSKARIEDYEIIVVNDGSTDNSLGEAVRFKRFNGHTEKIKIYHYNANIGKGFALRFGFYKSAGNPVIFLDGDTDIKTTQIIKGLRVFFQNQADMVIGSKYHPLSRIFYPVERYIYSVILKLIIYVLFRLSVSDTQVGLKIFRREVLNEILPRLVIKRFAADLELLVVAHMLGYHRIHEIPVIIKQSVLSQSTIRIQAVRDFCLDILAIFYRKNWLKYYNTEQPTYNPHLTIQTA